MLKPPDFKQSRDTEIIFNIFQDLPSRPDHQGTWHELCEATGKPKHKIVGCVQTAKKRMRRDFGIVVENVRNIGYQVLQDREIANSGQLAIERARRVQSVGLEKMNCVDTKRLNFEERAVYDVRKSVLELTLLASRPRTISNINQMVIRKRNELDQEEMVQAIKDALIKKS